jgi:AcrR family transcriptional regulator
MSDRQRSLRRKEILEAALAVFIRKGYQRATVDDVAQEVGLSVGALYRYFPRKADLILTLIDLRLAKAPKVFARVTQSIQDPWQRLVACVDTFVGALRLSHPENGRLLLVAFAEAIHDPDVRSGLHQRFNGVAKYLAGVINTGVQTGSFRPVDAENLSRLLVCLADGSTLYWVTKNPEVSLSGLRQSTLDLLRSLLLPAPKPS